MKNRIKIVFISVTLVFSITGNSENIRFKNNFQTATPHQVIHKPIRVLSMPYNGFYIPECNTIQLCNAYGECTIEQQCR